LAELSPSQQLQKEKRDEERLAKNPKLEARSEPIKKLLKAFQRKKNISMLLGETNNSNS